ncbi:universal stress protein [Streptomyces sp. CWNU-52B]|uniref:universal stress protein n=1 Tax=unclassified Streptomyces TaxID=2593676 RepID=UPI0039BF1C23
MRVHQVVAGVDGSLVSVRALDRAADEAARRAAALRVLYAVPDLDEAGPILAAAAARVRARRPGLPVTTQAVRGSAVRALAHASEDAALTVVGTRGLRGFTGMLLGSVSLRLAAHAHGPLLVVRGDHRCGDGGEVLLGLAGEADTDAAAHAFQEAERRGARLRVLHSWNQRHITPELPLLAPASAQTPAQARLTRRAGAEESVPRYTMARLQEQHPAVGIDARTVRTGPAHALLEATRTADVVVIGAHRRTHHVAPRLGPVAHTLLHRSHCPVLVVPSG